MKKTLWTLMMPFWIVPVVVYWLTTASLFTVIALIFNNGRSDVPYIKILRKSWPL